MTWVNTGGAVSGGGVTNSPYASEAEVQALKTDGLAGGAISVTASGSTTARSLAARAADVVNIKDFGAKCDGLSHPLSGYFATLAAAQAVYPHAVALTDEIDWAAIVGAINSKTYGTGTYVSGPTVLFPSGTCIVNRTLELKKSVRLLGEGSGESWSSTAELRFPAGVTGITVNRYNTINGGLDSPATTAADSSIIEGLRITGSGGATAHGVWLRARALIRNCYISGFSGNGINIVADSGGGAANMGNANNFRVEGGSSNYNGGHGIYTQGGDSNAGYVIGADVSYNSGWGVYDASFLGNTYVAMHAAANTLGAYKADNANARNVFLGCYSESGQPASSIAAPSQMIGGTQSAGLTGSGVQFVDSKISNATLSGGTGVARMMPGQNDSVFGFSSTGDANSWQWEKRGTEYGFTYANSAIEANRPFRLERSDTTVGPYGSAGVKMKFTMGFWLGYSAAQRFMTFWSGAPTGGTWNVGDIVFNPTPTPGGAAGWVCTAAGTPGTWQRFGSVELRGTGTLATGAIAAGTTVSQTITVTGAAVGAEVAVGGPATLEAGLILYGYVSATNTVTLRVANVSAGSITPAAAQTVSVRVFNP